MNSVQLRQELSERDLVFAEEKLQLMEHHLDYILKKNTTIRFTAIHDRNEAMRLHVLDSLLALPEVLAAPQGVMLDLGTGGGYPGFPLAIAAKRPTDLLDSVQKKAGVLQTFLDESHTGEPPITSIGARAEELALERPGYYSVVLARAVSSLPALLELAAPLLCDGGQLIAYKGAADKNELERSIAAATIVGMRHRSTRDYVLPAGGEQRTIYVFERQRAATIDLPRRSGRAQRKPLA